MMTASRVALAWARVYTSGMPEHHRAARINELTSDLWDHANYAAAGHRRSAIQRAIVGRTVRGIAADLAWRTTHRSRPIAVAALRSVGWTGFVLAASLLLFFTGSSGAPVVGLYTVEDWAPGDAREFARVTATIFVALVAGLALLKSRPLVATTLISAASGSVALYVACLWPLLVPSALACTAGAGVIARRRRRRCAGPTTLSV